MTALLEAEGIVRTFTARTPSGPRPLTAVDGVSLSVQKGHTLGVVGESGCGKSTLARCLLRLIEPDAGRIVFDGVDVTRLSLRAMRPLRRRAQIVFQDPVGSLNPRLKVRRVLYEPMQVHAIARTPAELESRAVALLERVGLGAGALDRYPHELSGGQRQRLGIARALSVEPELIVADEPVSSLDVSVRAQVVNLFMDLKSALGLTYVFIAHDLGLVQHVADEVAVMVLGRIVEQGPVAALYAKPAHPYTQALLAAAPRLDAPPAAAAIGEPPSALDPPSGCHYHPRCARAEERCRRERPALRAIGGGRAVACHLPILD